jgi:hypothetical protein
LILFSEQVRYLKTIKFNDVSFVLDVESLKALFHIKTMDSYKFRLFDILDMSRSNKIVTKYVDLAFIKKGTN